MPKKVWCWCCRLGRWCRLAGLVSLALALAGWIYLNQVGVPDWVKARLVAELRGRGVDFNFQRLRLHWIRGLVADHIQVGPINARPGPQLSIEEAEVQLSFSRLLWHQQLHVDGLAVQRAALVLPLNPDDRAAPPLRLDDLTAELRFNDQDGWELIGAQARFLGAKVRAKGTLAHVASSRPRSGRQPTNTVASAAWQRQVQQLVQQINLVQFDTPPEVQLTFQGDARDWSSLTVELGVKLPRATASWGGLEGCLLTAVMTQLAEPPHLIQTRFRLTSDQVRTAGGVVNHFQATGRVLQPTAGAVPVRAELELQARPLHGPGFAALEVQALAEIERRGDTSDCQARVQLQVKGLQTEWGKAVTAQGTFLGVYPLPDGLNPDGTRPRAGLPGPPSHPIVSPTAVAAKKAWNQWLPSTGAVALEAEGIETPWGRGKGVQLRVQRGALRPGFEPSNPDWGFWRELAPYNLGWSVQVQEVVSPKLEVEDLAVAGEWCAPTLTVSSLQARLYGGGVDSSGALDVDTRQAQVQGQFDFDAHRLKPLLTPGGQRWINQFAWEQPPVVEAQAGLVVPPWTKLASDWKKTLQPSVWLTGRFRGGAGGFRGVPVTAAQSRFTLTNQVWQLPDLMVTRPEGRVVLGYVCDVPSQDYRWTINSQFDPKALKPLLGAGAQKGLDYFEFGSPPAIEGELWGRWHEVSRLGFLGRLTATNFTLRGEPRLEVRARLSYTNQFLHATDVDVRQDSATVQSPGVGVDLEKQLLFITNAWCHMDPLVVTRMIGPKTTQAITPYRFHRPPVVRVEGTVPLRDADHSRLQFDVSGGPFTYWRFTVPAIQGRVLWQGDYLILTNMTSGFYAGQLAGHAAFDFTPPRSADFGFHVAVTNANLQALMADISPATNQLEGRLNGQLTITRANSDDWKSWNGFGRVELQDGLIWDIPLFGVLTPVLSSVSPALSHSRASEATATFTLTNSVITTHDLEARSPALRLYYDGTVDFHGQVNARAEASLFRDTWLMGRFVSLAFSPLTKLFEYKVTGTLRQPITEPLYIPKFMLIPFHPWRSVKEWFPETPAPILP